MTYPQHGWGQQPAPVEPPAASRKVLGITAAVLGAAIGLAVLVFGVWIGILGAITAREFETFEGYAAFVGALGGLFLLIGSLVHGWRRNPGRVLMAIGAVPALAFGAILPLGPVLAGAALVPVALAFLSRSWCRPKQQAYPQQYGYQYPQQYGYQYPQQQYPQQPQQWQR